MGLLCLQICCMFVRYYTLFIKFGLSQELPVPWNISITSFSLSLSLVPLNHHHSFSMLICLWNSFLSPWNDVNILKIYQQHDSSFIRVVNSISHSLSLSLSVWLLHFIARRQCRVSSKNYPIHSSALWNWFGASQVVQFVTLFTQHVHVICLKQLTSITN